MSNAEKFLQALQAQSAKAESKEDYWKRQRDTWLEDLRELRRNITSWIEPLSKAGVADIREVDFAVTEPDVGRYMAPGLALDILADPPKTVDVRPRGARVVGVVETGGRRVVGANGRVDLEWQLRREILLRFREGGVTRWRSFGGGEPVELNAESFFVLLGRVTDIRLEK